MVFHFYLCIFFSKYWTIKESKKHGLFYGYSKVLNPKSSYEPTNLSLTREIINQSLSQDTKA